MEQLLYHYSCNPEFLKSVVKDHNPDDVYRYINHRFGYSDDNNFGLLYSIYRYLHPHNISIGSIPLTLHLPDQGVYRATKLLPLDLAQGARSFLEAITFDNTLPVIDQKTIFPRYGVWQALHDPFKITSTKTNDPKGWLWEHYSSHVWRICPKSVDDFIGSVLLRVAIQIKSLWSNTSFGNTSINVDKMYLVYQLKDKGYHCPKHNDQHPNRLISFIYYLTLDDWDYTIDGCELGIFKCDEYTPLNPTFNTMYAWNMTNGTSPDYFVNYVNHRPRLTIMGFFLI